MSNLSGNLDEYKRRCSAWGIVTPIHWETLILHKPDFGFKCRLGTFGDVFRVCVMCWELVRWRIHYSHHTVSDRYYILVCLHTDLKRCLKTLNDSSHHNQAIGGDFQTFLISPVYALNHGAIHIQCQPARGDADRHVVPTPIRQHCHGEPGIDRTGFKNKLLYLLFFTGGLVKLHARASEKESQRSPRKAEAIKFPGTTFSHNSSCLYNDKWLFFWYMQD